MARHVHGEHARTRAGSTRWFTWLSAAAVATSWLVACASVEQTTGGWVDRARSVTEDARVRYAATRHAQVFREPDASSEVVHRLLLHEKVLAHQVENGFAFIRAEQTGTRGWVLEQDLIETIPVPKPRAKVAPEAPQPQVVSPAEPSGEAVPEAASEAAPDAEPAPQDTDASAPEKSVFDPY